MDKRYIRFIDSHYNTLFHVPDGGKIRIHRDNEVMEYDCKFVDEYHTKIGNYTYHICEFAERMDDLRAVYEPVKEIGDLEFYEKGFYDSENFTSDGKRVPYYKLLKTVTKRHTSAEIQVAYGYCLSPSVVDMTFCKFESSFDGFSKMFGRCIEDICDDDSVCTRINNIVNAINDCLDNAKDINVHIAEASAVKMNFGSVKKETLCRDIR